MQDEEIECDLVLDEEQVKKYDKLEKSYDAPTYQVISDVFTGLTDKRVIKSKFRSSQGSQALKCSLKANEALLYPLERQLLSVPKPPSLLLHREIVRVTFSRVGGAGGGRTFEVKFSMDTGVEHTYSSIPREEFVYLESYCRDAGLEVENEMEAESATRAGFGDAMMDDDLSDDESEGRGKRAHRDINFAGVGGDDEDEGSSGKLFGCRPNIPHKWMRISWLRKKTTRMSVLPRLPMCRTRTRAIGRIFLISRRSATLLLEAARMKMTMILSWMTCQVLARPL